MSQIQILLIDQHKDAILNFSRERLKLLHSDPMEREMQSWTVRWRPEALDHYLPQGWSFGIFESERLLGFILAQPYLFHRGHTQTLWVEYVDGESPAVRQELLEVVQRWARDKHFQCVLIEEFSEADRFPMRRLVEAPLMELASSKI